MPLLRYLKSCPCPESADVFDRSDFPCHSFLLSAELTLLHMVQAVHYALFKWLICFSRGKRTFPLYNNSSDNFLLGHHCFARQGSQRQHSDLMPAMHKAKRPFLAASSVQQLLVS